MFINARLASSLVASLFIAAGGMAQEANPPAQPIPGTINLNVVVTAKSGPPVNSLQQQDFTILDNKVPQSILSFRAVRGREAPIEIVLVVDDVNTGISNVAYERTEIDKFLKTDAGQLSHPVALAFLTDAGIKVQNDFSSDGNALATAVDQYTLGLHSILRSGGIYSAVDRFRVSMSALLELATREAGRPGRKIILWVSPGWPILSGPGVEQQLDAKQQQQIFDTAVKLSTLLREGHVTLYSIDPLGTADFAGRAFRWEAFTKGISKPSQAEWGNLALQVIATQSGGLALTASNDVTGLLQQCVADTQAYYEISFSPSLDQKPATYHRLEVRLADRKMTARTNQGYYVQTLPH
ncbi:MAG: VWA domain-containing protein [Candidatus Acidiferrum sp.]